MTDLTALIAARETAWLAYDKAQRGIPDCEHVEAWKAEVKAARAKHDKALRELDKAIAAQEAVPEPPPEPDPPSVPDDPLEQEPLFEIEAA